LDEAGDAGWLAGSVAKPVPRHRPHNPREITASPDRVVKYWAKGAGPMQNDGHLGHLREPPVDFLAAGETQKGN